MTIWSGARMHTVGLLVYANFQAMGLAVASVFEYTNRFRGEQAYVFRLVSEEGGPVMTSQHFSVNTERLREYAYDTLIVAGDNDCQLPACLKASMRRRIGFMPRNSGSSIPGYCSTKTASLWSMDKSGLQQA